MLRMASLVVLLTAGVGIVASPAGAAGAMRPVDYTVNGSLRAGALTLDDLRLAAPAAGGATDEILLAPRDRLDFVPIDGVEIGAPGPPFDHVAVTVGFEPLTDLRATIDLATGAVTDGTLQAQLVLTAPGYFSGCPIGPLDLDFDSVRPGGIAYDATTGLVTVVDDAFTLPPVPAGAPGCAAFDADVNAALGLEAGTATADITLTIGTNPLLTPPDPPVAVPTTATTTTTTATTTTTTTAAVAPSPPSSSQAASTSSPQGGAVASQTAERPASNPPAASRAKPPTTDPVAVPPTSGETTTTQAVAIVGPGTTQTPPAVPEDALAAAGPRAIRPIAEAAPDATPRRVAILLGSAVLVAFCLALMRSEVRASVWARRRRRSAVRFR